MLQHMNVCLLTHICTHHHHHHPETIRHSIVTLTLPLMGLLTGSWKGDSNSSESNSSNRLDWSRWGRWGLKDRWNKAIRAWPRLPKKTKSTWRAGRVEMQQIPFYLNLARRMLSPSRLALPAINEPPVKVPLKARHCPTATKDVAERLFHRLRRTATERRFAALIGWWWVKEVCLAQRDFRGS